MSNTATRLVTKLAPPTQKGAFKKEKVKQTQISFLRFTIHDQISFAKRLAVLVRAGIPLLPSLQMMRKQMSTRSAGKMFDELIRDVENGQFISTSMAKFRRVFGDFAINIISIGEVSGTLHENLDYLAEELKKKQMLRRKVLSALLYPIFIVIATFGITLMLTVFLFPKIMPIFNSFSAELPWTTKILIAVSNALTEYGLFIFLGLVAFGVGFWFSLRVDGFRRVIDSILLRIPFLGSLLTSYNLANISRTLGLLLKSSVPIVKASTITADTTLNLAYRRELSKMADHIMKGDNISSHLEKSPRLFPPLMQQMVAVGEQAGSLSETLSYLADMYEHEVEDQTKNLTTVLEPILMVVMGLIVGFIAVSIITPIYGITQNLQR